MKIRLLHKSAITRLNGLFIRKWGNNKFSLFGFFLISVLGISWQTDYQHPRLLFSHQEIPAIREKAKTKEGTAIISQLKIRLNKPPEALLVGSYAAGYAFLYQLTGNCEYAGIARYFTELTLGDSLLFYSTGKDSIISEGIPLWNSTYKEIYRSPNIIGVALAYDLCFEVWDKTFREFVAGELAEKGASIIDGGGEGYNPNAWSNWQGITKGAGGLAMLAIENDKVVTTDVPGYLKKAVDGILAHLDWFSPKGWTPEGFNYLRYELCNGVIPFLLAWNNVKGELLFHEKVKWFLPMFSMQSIVRGKTIFIPMHGLGGSEWETSRWRSGDWVMGMGITPGKYLPAVKWTFDQAFGLNGDSTFNIFKPYDAIFALLNYPVEIAAENPGEVLKKVWADSVGGYFIFRNQWKNQDDFVVTLSANTLAKPASHSFRDAGSFRIYGFGTNWAVRPEKSEIMKGKDYENRVLVGGATNWIGATVSGWEEFPDGSAAVTLDMTKAYYGGARYRDSVNIGIEATRSFAVDYSKKTGAEVVIIVADFFKGGGIKTWQMHTGTNQVVTRNNIFKINGKNGTTLKGQFLYPHSTVTAFDSLTNTITAVSENHFLVVMTVQKKSPPEIKYTKHKFPPKITVGNQEFFIKNKRIKLYTP